MRDVVPSRLTWAVQQLPPTVVGPVLEVGCGAGEAAALLLARFPTTPVTAIDRSATQIARARARLAAPVEAGRLRLACLALEAAPRALGHDAFALVLAVNVNAFWTAPARARAAAATLLAPGGHLYLVYEPPGADRVPVLRARLHDTLTAGGFTDVASVHAVVGGAALVCVRATRPPGTATPPTGGA